MRLLQVKGGCQIPPTGEEDVYPLPGLCGCLQIDVTVGTGTQVAVVEGVSVLLVAVAVQVYTETVVVGGEDESPEGGFLDLQLETEQEPPGHELPQ